jgi:hypothetical protein
MYVERNTETLICNHRYSGKAIRVAQRECVFVALGNRHVTAMRHIVIRSLLRSTIYFFSHYLTNGTIFEKKCY